MSRMAQKRAEARQRHVRQKALQPEERFCRIQKCRVTVLVEYMDYVSHWNKGPEGELYCENIIQCYQANIPCRYSGISPLYADPFEGVPRDVREAERLFCPPAESAAEEPSAELEPEEEGVTLDSEGAPEASPEASPDAEPGVLPPTDLEAEPATAAAVRGE